MSDFDRKNIARYTLIMAHLELLYANDCLSDEDLDKLEKVFAQNTKYLRTAFLDLKAKSSKRNVVVK